MTAVPQPPAEQRGDVAAWLDRLEELRTAATPGVWKLWGMTVMADQDGTSNVDTAVEVAHTYMRNADGKPRTFDAMLICEMQRAVPQLVAAIRGVVHEHQRIEPPHQDAGFCLGCDVSWPCPTYRTVAAALTDGTPR